MTDTITITRDELEHIQERAKKLALDKSYLQLVIRLINKMSSASGLEDTIDCMLNNILDVIGGIEIVLYYWIENDIFCADVYGRKSRLETIDDSLVIEVISSREPLEIELPFSETKMSTPEFTKAYTWVYPLTVGSDLIGVLKMENLHFGMRDLYQYLPTFFSFTSLVLKNEILGHTRVKKAYDQLSDANRELTNRIEERKRVEEELRKTRDELEERVAERTAELRIVNEQLNRELAERELAQEALRKSSEEIRDLYNRAPCGYHSLDKDGVFVRVNDTELNWLERTREEIIGKLRFSEVLTGKSQETFRDNFPLFLEQGWIKDMEFEIVRRDGTILTVLVSSIAIYDQAGEYLMSRSTLFDISKRRRAEEEVGRLYDELEKRVTSRTHELQETQGALMNIVEDLNEKTAELEVANMKLKELDRLKSMFIASMSHELRTPLNSIIGFSSILHDEWLGSMNAEQKENLGIIRQSGRHLLNLINDVIDVSKIEAGKIESSVEEFDLSELVGEAVEMVRKEAEEKGLVVRVDASGMMMRTDRRRLLQCLLNLLSNGVKYTGKGSVTVEARALQDVGETGMGGRAEISVADTGIGIREEDAQRLFQPFVRLGSPLMTIVPGTGLGLYLTKKLAVEVLKGEISFSSEFGRGSRFVIRVPANIS